VNGQDAMNGFTVTKTSNEQAPVITEAAGLDSGADGDNNHRVADCQPSSTELVYDLHIHNQTLLWRAQPKPSYNNQVVSLFYFFALFPVL